MLVLTRKLDEKVQIGPNITLTIVRIKGHAVQIGIEAPDQVRVLRGELAAAEDLRADGSGLSGSTPSGLPGSANDKSEPKPGRSPAGKGPNESQDLGRRASRRFLPPHESCSSGAGDLMERAVSVGPLALAWR